MFERNLQTKFPRSPETSARFPLHLYGRVLTPLRSESHLVPKAVFRLTHIQCFLRVAVEWKGAGASAAPHREVISLQPLTLASVAQPTLRA